MYYVLIEDNFDNDVIGGKGFAMNYDAWDINGKK